MPIYRQTYRTYDGVTKRHFRWAAIIEQEIRVMIKARPLVIMMLVGLLHVILRIFQVSIYNTVANNPNSPLMPLVNQIHFLAVNEKMFLDFIRIQSPLVFLVLLFSGAGMICNDVKNNLMEVYFSKPISWRDYVIGKTSTLILLGLALTAIPAVFLIVMNFLLAPSMDLFYTSLTWLNASVQFSLVIVIPIALTVLASSSLLPSSNYASITVFMLLAADSVMAGLLAEILHNRNYLILSFPIAVHRVGQELFDDLLWRFDLDWRWALLFVFVVCVASLSVVIRRARRAEYSF